MTSPIMAAWQKEIAYRAKQGWPAPEWTSFFAGWHSRKKAEYGTAFSKTGDGVNWTTHNEVRSFSAADFGATEARIMGHAFEDYALEVLKKITSGLGIGHEELIQEFNPCGGESWVARVYRDIEEAARKADVFTADIETRAEYGFGRRPWIDPTVERKAFQTPPVRFAFPEMFKAAEASWRRVLVDAIEERFSQDRDFGLHLPVSFSFTIPAEQFLGGQVFKRCDHKATYAVKIKDGDGLPDNVRHFAHLGVLTPFSLPPPKVLIRVMQKTTAEKLAGIMMAVKGKPKDEILKHANAFRLVCTEQMSSRDFRFRNGYPPRLSLRSIEIAI